MPSLPSAVAVIQSPRNLKTLVLGKGVQGLLAIAGRGGFVDSVNSFQFGFGVGVVVMSKADNLAKQSDGPAGQSGGFPEAIAEPVRNTGQAKLPRGPSMAASWITE
jgi:hypothetical protein